MKKVTLLTAGIAAIMMTACQKEENALEQKEMFTVTATMPQKADTRLTFEEADGTPKGLTVKWANGDVIKDAASNTYTLTGGAETTSGTFTFDTEPTDEETFTYGKWVNAQAQVPSSPMAHMSAVLAMTGTYNTTTQNIAFKHQTAVMRIALSGLKKSTALRILDVHANEPSKYIRLDLGTNINFTEDDGTFVAWIVANSTWLNGESNLTFKLFYGDSSTQEYTHSFSTALVGDDLKGKLLHCNINFETKVGITVGFGDDATWLNPVYTLPPGYTHMVYDAATFAALPTADANAVVIQLADITLTTEQVADFLGKYNGNGHTISKTSGAAFTTLTNEAYITNTHMRGGASLVSTTGSSASIEFSKCSSIGAALVEQAGGATYFTLCSTDQTALVASGSGYIYACCWYNGATQNTGSGGYVWKESTKSTVYATAAQLFVDGKIQWDYEP